MDSSALFRRISRRGAVTNILPNRHQLETESPQTPLSGESLVKTPSSLQASWPPTESIQVFGYESDWQPYDPHPQGSNTSQQVLDSRQSASSSSSQSQTGRRTPGSISYPTTIATPSRSRVATPGEIESIPSSTLEAGGCSSVSPISLLDLEGPEIIRIHDGLGDGDDVNSTSMAMLHRIPFGRVDTIETSHMLCNPASNPLWSTESPGTESPLQIHRWIAQENDRRSGFPPIEKVRDAGVDARNDSRDGRALCHNAPELDASNTVPPAYHSVTPPVSRSCVPYLTTSEDWEIWNEAKFQSALHQYRQRINLNKQSLPEESQSPFFGEQHSEKSFHWEGDESTPRKLARDERQSSDFITDDKVPGTRYNADAVPNLGIHSNISPTATTGRSFLGSPCPPYSAPTDPLHSPMDQNGVRTLQGTSSGFSHPLSSTPSGVSYPYVMSHKRELGRKPSLSRPLPRIPSSPPLQIATEGYNAFFDDRSPHTTDIQLFKSTKGSATNAPVSLDTQHAKIKEQPARSSSKTQYGPELSAYNTCVGEMDTSQVLACSRSAEGKHINAQEAPMQFLSTETEGINNQTKGSVISGLTKPGPPMLECSPPSNRVKGPHPFPEEEDRGSREHRSTKHSQETTLRNSSCGAPTYSVQTVHNNMHDGEDWNGGNSGSIKAEGKIRSKQHRKHGEGGMDTVHKKKSLFHVIIFGIFCALCLRNA